MGAARRRLVRQHDLIDLAPFAGRELVAPGLVCLAQLVIGNPDLRRQAVRIQADIGHGAVFRRHVTAGMGLVEFVDGGLIGNADTRHRTGGHEDVLGDAPLMPVAVDRLHRSLRHLAQGGHRRGQLRPRQILLYHGDVNVLGEIVLEQDIGEQAPVEPAAVVMKGRVGANRPANQFFADGDP